MMKVQTQVRVIGATALLQALVKKENFVFLPTLYLLPRTKNQVLHRLKRNISILLPALVPLPAFILLPALIQLPALVLLQTLNLHPILVIQVKFQSSSIPRTLLPLATPSPSPPPPHPPGMRSTPPGHHSWPPPGRQSGGITGS